MRSQGTEKNKILSLSESIIDDLGREYKSYRVKGINSIVFLTYRCTSRCKSCNIWRRNSGVHDELDWDGWKTVFAKLRDSGIRTVELFGGDALLRKDVIFNIIRFCTENGIETFLPTNSILLDKATARELVDAGLGTVYFSLDDIESESDSIRGVKGTFDRIKQALDSIIEARSGYPDPKIIICCTISSMNSDRFMHVVDFLKDYPVDAIYPRVVVEFSKESIRNSEVNGISPDPFFVSSEDRSHYLSLEQTEAFKQLIMKLKMDTSGTMPYINFQGVDAAPESAFISGQYGVRRCQVCTTVVTVNPNGDVVPCFFYPEYVLGNLCREDGLDNIWGNQFHRDFINSQRKNKIDICTGCNMPSTYATFPQRMHYYLGRIKDRILHGKE